MTAAPSDQLPGSTPSVGTHASPGSLQSVSRALRLLDVVAASRTGLTAKDAAAALGVALPTAYHLLTTLTDAGYLVHLTAERRFALGYQVRVLEQGLCRQLAAPSGVASAINRLHDEADAAAYYAVYRDAEIVVSHIVDSRRRPRVPVVDVGFHGAAHATAFGKVMLAALPVGTRRSRLAGIDWRPYTRRTIVDPRVLEEHLVRVRDSGVATEIGEFLDGVSCLAAPVRAPGGSVVGSVAISLPSPVFTIRRWQLERAVRRCAAAVNQVLRAREQ